MISRTGLFICSILFLIAIAEQSCLPYKTYEKHKPSSCLFLNLNELTIDKFCNDGNYDSIVFLEVEVWYDTVKIIRDKPSSSYILYRINHTIKFPYKLDTRVYENRNSDMTISLKTDKRQHRYGVRVNKSDWNKDKIALTYYYDE